MIKTWKENFLPQRKNNSVKENLLREKFVQEDQLKNLF